MSTDTVEEIRADHAGRRGSQIGQYRLNHARATVLLERIDQLEGQLEAAEQHVKILQASRPAEPPSPPRCEIECPQCRALIAHYLTPPRDAATKEGTQQ